MALPVLVGAAQDTFRLVVPAAATVGAAGTPGLAFGVPLPDGDHLPLPTALPARTCTSCAAPAVSPAMVVEVPAPVKAWSLHVEEEASL